MADNKGVLFVPYKDTLGTPERRGGAQGVRGRLSYARARQRGVVEPAQLQARRGGRLPQPLARQVGLPQGRADDRRPHLQLLRRWGAQYGRRARLYPLHRAVRSSYRQAARHCRRALELCGPQRRGCRHRLQMGRPNESQGARPRRHRHHGDELAALPLDHVQILGNPVHVTTAGDAAGLRRSNGRRSSASRSYQRIRSRRSSAAQTLRSAARRRAIS